MGVGSENDKKSVLIVDEETVSLEILKDILQNDFHLLQTSDIHEAADLIRKNRDHLSVILLHEKQDGKNRHDELSQRLIDDFETAVREEQFEVFYQPKFNIKSDIPVLTSAEALVRWNHPELGCIAPDSFIPLFEENGLIRKLDLYVWKKAALQIREWKKRLKISVPVSVNVSRVDLNDPLLADHLKELIEEADIAPQDLLLEITESAYMDNEEEIIARVCELRSLGFMIGMDDFGVAYSNLNIITHLPIDALKIDRRFIVDAFSGKGDTRMIEIIIDIAGYLGVLVVAEGVEDRKQLQSLKDMGCDIVQGYCFSKPLKAKDFEVFLEEKMRSLSRKEI